MAPIAVKDFNAVGSSTIDIVYLWVDGSDPTFLALKEQYARKAGPGCDVTPVRFWHCDELRYSLRSVTKFAPWLRHIFVVTNGQVPAWLHLSSKISLVFHHDIFPDKSHLPTFSSMAIECHLHRIPNLAEKFLYANDDTFFGSPVQPNDFFADDQIMATLLDSWNIDSKSPTGRALTSVFGPGNYRCPSHQIRPLTKSLFDMIDTSFPGMFSQISSHRFRHRLDMHVAYQLATSFALKARVAVEAKRHEIFVDVLNDISWAQWLELIRFIRPQLFCINNAIGPRCGRVRDFLENYFPEPGPFEKSMPDAS